MIIVSGPSTVGKNPLIYKICEIYDYKYVRPCTTRAIRSEEINGKDYDFFTKSEFQLKIQNREIVEWDYCLENYYGYMFDFPGDINQITHGLSRMALRIKSKFPNDVTTVFLMPKDTNRIFYTINKIYSGKALALRQSLVEEEIRHSVLFDKVFTVSDSVFDLLNDKEMIEILLLNNK